jgi:hypothetical protein
LRPLSVCGNAVTFSATEPTNNFSTSPDHLQVLNHFTISLPIHMPQLDIYEGGAPPGCRLERVPS